MSAPTRVDWDAAFNHYAALGPLRTFVAVAHRFGVSDTAVRQRAARDGWADRVGEIDAAAREKAAKDIVRDRAVRLADTIKLVDLARTEAIEKLQAGATEVRLLDMPGLLKIEALLEGEATERVSFDEVQSGFRTVIGVAFRFIPVEHRREFLEAAEHALGSGVGEQRALPEAT